MLRIRGPLILVVATLGGCANTPKLSVSARDVSGTSCAPLAAAPTSVSLPLLPEIPSYSTDNASLSAGLSPKARQIAEIIGILPLVREIRTFETTENRLQAASQQRLLELRQSFSERMMTTFFEVSGLIGQIDCEAIRADQVANTLNEIRDQRAQRYEIIAIVGDALVGVAGGALALGVSETASAIADIFGGNLAVGFGLAAGITEEEHEFRDPQNFLRDLWEAPPKPAVFPETVWRFLNWPSDKKVAYPTIRQELIAEWQDDGFIAKAGTKDRRTTLLFGSGGVYEIEDLRARAQMLEELKTYVNRMVQQLHLLSREVSNRQPDTSPKAG